MTEYQAEPSQRPDPVDPITLSRTWELELFISGATVFALLQAPDAVDQWWIHAEPHVDGTTGLAAFFAYYYAKLILYTLIATFLVHLVTRAYWVGLVGLHSVYPGGIRWEELKLGPAFNRVYRERLPGLQAAIARVDNASSLLFSGGALILVLFLASILLVGFTAALSFALGTIFFGGRYVVLIGAVLVAASSILPALVKALDTRHGRKYGPDANPGRRLVRAATLTYYLGAAPITAPLMLVLSSNLGKRTANIALAVVFSAIVGTFLVRDVLIGNDALRADSYRYLPDERALQYNDPAYYADQRDPREVYPLTAAVQSEIIRDPYVRLFLPITPNRHNPLIEERCPGVQEFESGLRLVSPRDSPEPPDVTLLLRCLSELQPISIDGRAIPEPRFNLTQDPVSGIRGMVAHIPVAGLGPGEHVLRVEGLPRTQARSDQPPRSPMLIRFWI